MDVPTPATGCAMPGYAIAPAEHLLGLPGSWPAYLGPLWDGYARRPEVFGADAADVDAAAEALYGATEPWPAYRVPLPAGAVVWVVHRDHPDGAGTDFVLTRPDLPGEVSLASLDGHHRGPGFSRPDLLGAAGAVPPGAEGVRDPDVRLLLLLPAFGDALTPAEEAVRRVGAALTAVGVAAGETAAVAEGLLDHPYRGGTVWSGPQDSPLSGGGGGHVPAGGALFSPAPDPAAPASGTA